MRWGLRGVCPRGPLGEGWDMLSLRDLVGAPRRQNAALQMERAAQAIEAADAVVIGAGSGVSTAAGFTYAGERFARIFGDFIERYGFTDMYFGGFYPFDTFGEHWAYWSRYIWWNRYVPAQNDLYGRLLELVRDRDYFVLTTNVDHQFQRAGFDKQRLFYTQGDYGLFQCSEPCHRKTYDNEDAVRRMLEAQGYAASADGSYRLPDGVRPQMSVPDELVPYCPVCGRPMSMNLRADNTFVEDDGWHAAAGRWHDFQRRHRRGRVVYLELGVGWNTPVIIKFPFWQAVAENPEATYVCINKGEAVAPAQIERQSVLIDGGLSPEVVEGLKGGAVWTR